MTLLADVNCPGSQEDLVSNWEPAHSFAGHAVSGAKVAPSLRLLALAVTHLPLAGDGLVCSQLVLLWYLLSPLFCEQAQLCLRLTFSQESSLSLFFSLRRSHSLGCYLTLAPSDCPQGVQAWSLP